MENRENVRGVDLGNFRRELRVWTGEDKLDLGADFSCATNAISSSDKTKAPTIFVRDMSAFPS